MSGLYRVRRQGAAGAPLVYVGQTQRGLRQRLLALARGVEGAECPFNDPHTAAPHLWLLRHIDSVGLECSCAPVEGDSRLLRAVEDYLLWRHRVEAGAPTEANFGRFYRGYSRSTNRWVVTSRGRMPGRRATPLAQDVDAMDFALSHPALLGEGRLLQVSWWQRCPLAEAAVLPSTPAVYAIHDEGALTPIYIGQTSALAARVRAHTAATWPVERPVLSYLLLPDGTPKHVLHEVESDLLGWHFAIEKAPPALQYARASRDKGEGGATA